MKGTVMATKRKSISFRSKALKNFRSEKTRAIKSLIVSQMLTGLFKESLLDMSDYAINKKLKRLNEITDLILNKTKIHEYI
jgi:hypothetical protein